MQGSKELADPPIMFDFGAALDVEARFDMYADSVDFTEAVQHVVEHDPKLAGREFDVEAVEAAVEAWVYNYGDEFYFGNVIEIPSLAEFVYDVLHEQQ